MNPNLNNALPSGPWTGFFVEHHRPERGWMHLYLEFDDQKIRGEGTDYVGPWHISGEYNEVLCRWEKQYLGKHKVIYQGSSTENGILGQWQIEHSNLIGKFHIWPSFRTEIQQQYLEDELSTP